MKIVIANGTNQAAYLVDLFKKQKHKLILINSNRADAGYLLKTKHVPVFVGNPWRAHVLEEAGVSGADLFISLCESDYDNFTCCLLAKKVFKVDKVICSVSNPNNVEIYKKLGLDSVVSSTYLLGQSIQSQSSVESIISTLTLENEKIVLVEFTIKSTNRICYKKIMNLDFPKYASIAAIYRSYSVIIPNGQVQLKPKDKLLIVTSKENEGKLLTFLKGEA